MIQLIKEIAKLRTKRLSTLKKGKQTNIVFLICQGVAENENIVEIVEWIPPRSKMPVAKSSSMRSLFRRRSMTTDAQTTAPRTYRLLNKHNQLFSSSSFSEKVFSFSF